VKPHIEANEDKVTHEKIRRWFLANYDLEHLQIFEKYINKINGKKTKQNEGYSGSTNRTDNYLFYKYFYSKHLIAEFFKYVFPVLFILLLFLGLYSFFQSTKNVMIGYNIGIFCGVLSISISISIFIFVLLKHLPSGLFNKSSSLLRLIGCILAGYLALNSDESITGIIIINNLPDCSKVVFRWVIFFAFTYIYLKREISNKISKNKADPNKLKAAIIEKTLDFSIRLVGYALIVGFFFSDLFGRTMLSRNINEIGKLVYDPTLNIDELAHFPFIVGNIYPEAILSQAPLAMFIGIFINLLWEDKALTEPL